MGSSSILYLLVCDRKLARGLGFELEIPMVSHRVRLNAVGSLNRLIKLHSTPIVNALSDAYPLLRFLRIRPWYDWQEFNPYISRIEKKNRGFLRCEIYRSN
jgi:hypothetical protein